MLLGEQLGRRHECGLHAVLGRVVDFVSSIVPCDSCFMYVLEEDDLVLRASKTPHPDVIDRLKLRVGQGITGWVAEHRQPVAVGRNAFKDPRFQTFNELPEDRYEAFLSVPVLSRGKLVGVINLQQRLPHDYSRQDIQLISTIGFLVGAEIEMARLEVENSQLSERLGDAEWLDGEFSAGDLLMVTVLRRLEGSDLLNEYPNLSAYVARGEARPAYKRAFDAQLAVFTAASAG